MPKLTNGHIDTPTMIRLLTKHPDWTASAPHALNQWTEMRAKINVYKNGSRKVSISFPDTSVRVSDAGIDMPIRNDWTIHRPDGDWTMHRGKKRELVRIGKLENSTLTLDTGRDPQLAACLMGHDWTIYAEREQ